MITCVKILRAKIQKPHAEEARHGRLRVRVIGPSVVMMDGLRLGSNFFLDKPTMHEEPRCAIMQVENKEVMRDASRLIACPRLNRSVMHAPHSHEVDMGN